MKDNILIEALDHKGDDVRETDLYESLPETGAPKSSVSFYLPSTDFRKEKKMEIEVEGKKLTIIMLVIKIKIKCKITANLTIMTNNNIKIVIKKYLHFTILLICKFVRTSEARKEYAIIHIMNVSFFKDVFNTEIFLFSHFGGRGFDLFTYFISIHL